MFERLFEYGFANDFLYILWSSSQLVRSRYNISISKLYNLLWDFLEIKIITGLSEMFIHYVSLIFGGLLGTFEYDGVAMAVSVILTF